MSALFCISFYILADETHERLRQEETDEYNRFNVIRADSVVNRQSTGE